MLRHVKTAGLAGILAVSSLAGCAQNRKEIVFYTSLSDNSFYTSEVVLLAEEFLEKNLPMFDFKFEYTDKEKIGFKELNHVDRFALVEEDIDVRAKDLASALAENDESKKHLESLAQRAYMNFSAETDGERATIYLLVNPAATTDVMHEVDKLKYLSTRLLRDSFVNEFGSNPETRELIERMNEDLANWDRDIKKYESELIKWRANTIVHEIGHLCGLWHPEHFKNDNLEDYVSPGLPNVMSDQKSGAGKFGYAFEKEQIKQMREYFNQGQIFQEMKSFGFNFETFLDNLARKNGWVKAEVIQQIH